MANIIKLGSILLDGARVKPGAQYQTGQKISFSHGDDIQWVVVNGLMIANRSLLVNVSWDDLDRHGFVFGKLIGIEGYDFLCRLLQVGTQEDEPNEWDTALDTLGEDDSLWNWKDIGFWGQECAVPLYRSLRGYYSARYRVGFPSPSRSILYGFRPVLEPVQSETLVHGASICAIGGQSILRGKLQETTGYDAVIIPDPASMMSEADEGKCYVKLSNGTVLFDRSQMTTQAIKEV